MAQGPVSIGGGFAQGARNLLADQLAQQEAARQQALAEATISQGERGLDIQEGGLQQQIMNALLQQALDERRLGLDEDKFETDTRLREKAFTTPDANTQFRGGVELQKHGTESADAALGARTRVSEGEANRQAAMGRLMAAQAFEAPAQEALIGERQARTGALGEMQNVREIDNLIRGLRAVDDVVPDVETTTGGFFGLGGDTTTELDPQSKTLLDQLMSRIQGGANPNQGALGPTQGQVEQSQFNGQVYSIGQQLPGGLTVVGFAPDGEPLVEGGQ